MAARSRSPTESDRNNKISDETCARASDDFRLRYVVVRRPRMPVWWHSREYHNVNSTECAIFRFVRWEDSRKRGTKLMFDQLEKCWNVQQRFQTVFSHVSHEYMNFSFYRWTISISIAIFLFYCFKFSIRFFSHTVSSLFLAQITSSHKKIGIGRVW